MEEHKNSMGMLPYKADQVPSSLSEEVQPIIFNQSLDISDVENKVNNDTIACP